MKLTPDQIIKIQKLYAVTGNMREVARELKHSRHTVKKYVDEFFHDEISKLFPTSHELKVTHYKVDMALFWAVSMVIVFLVIYWLYHFLNYVI